jgi:hypothetical protein
VVSFNDWLDSRGAEDLIPPIDPQLRARREWVRILRDPMTITIDREGVTLPPQTVRLSLPGAGLAPNAAAGSSQIGPVTIYGVRDHPLKNDPDNPVPDTDIKSGDRFWDELYREYQVETVTYLDGIIEVTAKSTV